MTLKLTQITDTHLTREHPERSKDLQRCIEAILNQPTLPDVVVHTGDVVHNGTAEEYREARSLLQNLNCPVYVIPGNRDHRENFLSCFCEDGYVTAQQPFVQFAIDDFATRLVFLDTHDKHSNKGQLCKDRLAQLQDMLSQRSAYPVVIFMHHAPFEAHEIPDPRQFTDWTQVDELADVISQYDNVQQVICGHVHRNIESSLAGKPASALTCLAGDLRKGAVTDEERLLPVFRTFELSSGPA